MADQSASDAEKSAKRIKDKTAKKMKRLLITGAAGFIGANFARYWLEKYQGDRVVVLDALTYAGNPANLQECERNPHFRFVKGDIGDRQLVDSLLAEENIDTIVNFAAESHVDRSIAGPDDFVRTNVTGTHTLLKAARDYWQEKEKNERHRFHHVSTDEVYGSLAPDEPAFTEANQYKPNSPYSASKAASDHFVRAYHKTYGLNVSISNCSNNYGPYQYPEKLIPLAIINLLHGKPVPLYGDGLNVRDWLYVEDHCRAIDLIIGKGENGRVYNVGGNNEWANRDILELVCRSLDAKFAAEPELGKRFPDLPCAGGQKAEELITHVDDRLGHDRRYAIDMTRIEQELGFTLAESFDTGIEKTIDWYLQNESWWRPLIGQDGMK